MEQLTVKEALEQGYEYYGIAERDYQTLQDIEDFSSDYIQEGETAALFDKTPAFSPTIDAEDLAELIAEHIQCKVDDNTNDDTNDVYDKVKNLDYSATAAFINKALEEHKYYNLTKIQLVPNETT